MNKIFITFLLLTSMLLISCSAMIAASGYKGTNISVLKKGTPKLLVLQELGEPEYTDGDKNFYKACKGKEGSTGRGMFHAVMSGLTLGLWEIIGTPIELISLDDKGCYYLFVVYDENEKIKEVALEERE